MEQKSSDLEERCLQKSGSKSCQDQYSSLPDSMMYDQWLDKSYERLCRKKTIPVLSLFFIAEILYVSWASLQMRILNDLESLKAAPNFTTGCLLLAYLAYVAVKDGVICLSLYKRVKCLRPLKLVRTHGVLLIVDIAALALLASTVCSNTAAAPTRDGSVDKVFIE